MLEVIRKGQATAANETPLLFVHGGCHAAWCWDEHFLDYFAGHGFDAAAVSLRGHGGSSLDKPLAKCSMKDYVADVRSVAESLERPPVLIGHSCGGFIVQKYLEQYTAPAGVLMASTPPSGILRASMRVWKRHPWVGMRANTIGQSHEVFNTPRLAREILYSAHTPEEVVVAGAQRVEPDSMRAVFTDQVFDRPHPERVSTQLLVLGGEDDGMITNDEVRATARAYNTEAILFPRMGHNMMVEPGWREVADCIIGWLSDRGM